MLAILIILILLIILTTIQIHIENLKIELPKKHEKNINTKYKITIKLYILEKINYLKLDITKDKMERQFMQKNIKKLKEKIEKDKNKFDIRLLSNIKKIKFKLKKINLKIKLGLEDAAINAIIVGTISSSISVIMGILNNNNIINVKKENQIYWKIMPIYQNRNLLNIDLNCIISFKLIHIIYIILSQGKKYPKIPVPKREKERKEKCQNIQ